MDVETRPVYLCRETLAGLLRQAWNNGYWNIMLLKMGSRGLNLRHFVPMVFVLALLLLGAAGVAWPPSTLALLSLAVIYLAADLVASLSAAVRRRLILQIPLLLLWFPMLHVTYGVASLVALLNRIPGDRPKSQTISL